MNIKAGTAEVVIASLTVAMADTVSASKSIAWVPTSTAYLVFQGYTTTAGDGGVGELDANNGNISIFDGSAISWVAFLDIHAHNCGTATSVIRTSGRSSVIRCEIHGCTGRAALLGNNSVAIGSKFYDATSNILDIGNGLVSHCYVSNDGTREGSKAINCSGASSTLSNNIISIDGATDGIAAVTTLLNVVGNSIYSNAGTGTGISSSDSNDLQGVIADNLIEGFSGGGGVGIDLSGTGLTNAAVGGNSIYDCTTEFTATTLPLLDDFLQALPYEILGASPFTNAAAGDFSPVDTGAVKEGSVFTFPTI